MLKSKPIRVLALLALAITVGVGSPFGTLHAATAPSVLTLTSPMAQATEPVTSYIAATQDMTTADPQRCEDETCVGAVQNMFLGLTDVDPKTQDTRNSLATKVDVNAAGDVWTYTLRNDVPWVQYNPTTKETKKLGMVTAADVVYGIQRVCDPRLGFYYTGLVAAMIKGCDVVAALKPEAVKDSDFDQIAVKALSDTQVQITLQGNLPYFKTASTLWVLRPVPKAIIEQFGDDWIQPGNIVTNGPFMLESWDKNVSRSFIKNPYYPKNVSNTYGGNIERISIIVVKDANTIYSLYQNNQVDASGLPRGEQDKVLKDPELSKQIVQTYDLAVSYIGFAYDKPPFDNVHVRRAFSAMLDRKAMVADLLGGRGAPMAHFMPPGIFGSVGINEVGIGDPKNLGFDPAFAKAEFDQVYKDCQGFPTITFLTEAANFAQYVQNAMKTYLGCDPSKMNIQQADFQVQIQGIKPNVPTPQRPNLWDLAWGPDYLDAQDWIYAVLSCHSENDAKRPCGDIDKQIDDASHETDIKKRAQMYRDLETAFFGQNGEFMIAPLFTGKNYSLYKPWYKGLFDTDALLGGGHWDTRRIDQAAQLAARGGGSSGGSDNSSGSSGGSSGDTTIPDASQPGATPEGTAAP